MRVRICAAAVVLWALVAGSEYVAAMPREAKISDSEIGVILLAHGSGELWNAAVAKALAEVGGGYKKELVFGMGSAPDIQKSVDRLEGFGVRAIVVVPLFLSSHSEMYRHFEYILGVRDEPDVLYWFLIGQPDSAHDANHDAAHGSPHSFWERVRFSVPYRVASPVNYHPVFARILAERLNGFAPETSVFLLSHGPITAEDDIRWRADLSQYGRTLSYRFPNARFYGLTWRDDAPPFIRDPAIRRIQDAVRRETAVGRPVVIVPFLLAPGGRENEIRVILEDCRACVILPATILPHPLAARYIQETIEQERAALFFR